MARVGVNLSWLVPGVVGGSEQATVRALAAVADAAPPDLEIVLFGLAEFADVHAELCARFETHILPIPARYKAVRVLAEHTWLPLAVRTTGIDLLHDAGGTSPGAVGVPRVVTIHDIQPLELPRNFPWLRVRYLRRAIPAALDRTEAVLVPSSFVRDSLVRVLGVDPARVEVVPWSAPEPVAGSESAAASALADLGVAAPFALLPAITYPHKGHVTAVRALHRLASRHPDLWLVLAGGDGPAEQDVADAITDLGLTDRVVRTGHLPTPAMVGLIAAADVLLFPSSYEGFGIPPLEAMAVGTPVIASAAASLPEVVGDGGILVAPGDDAQLAIEIHRILDEPEHRDTLVARGHRQAATFSPERTAEALVRAYRSVTTGR